MPEYEAPALASEPPADPGPPLPTAVAPVCSTDGHVSSAGIPPSRPAAPPHGEGDNPTVSTPAVERCYLCDTGSGRNLVICIDGTSNQFGMKNTNVVELYSRLEKSDKQLTFYNSGIGTYAEPSWKSWNYYMQVVANKLDLAFALRFERIIISAYAWLVDNYQQGDRIFLFGFSRGAYQVRALSAMIKTVGLLYKGNDDQIPFAYELYAASNKAETSSSRFADRIWNLRGFDWMLSKTVHSRQIIRGVTGRLQRLTGKASEIPRPGAFSRCWSRLGRLFDKSPTTKMRLVPRHKSSSHTTPEADDLEFGTLQSKFHSTFSRTVQVHFVGAWDTVSSVGVVRDKTLPMTTDGMRHVCFFRHALALHEYRVKFLPEYARGGDGPRDLDTYGDKPHVKEVWFSGSHSDIGGGSSINTTLDKFGPALRWMSLEATIAGLRIKNVPMKWEAVRPSSSMTPIWRLVECLPIKRLSYRSEDFVTRWPHLCGERRVKPYQKIHQTVYEDYTILSQPMHTDMEVDEWTTAGRFLFSDPEEYWKDRETLGGSDLEALNMLLKTETGYQSLLDRQIYRHIDSLALACWQRRSSSQNAGRALHGLALLRDGIFNRSYNSKAPETRLLNAVLTTSVAGGPEPFPFGLRGHIAAVSSIMFASPSLVVSGSRDGTLRLWDSESGHCQGNPASGHTERILGIAVSPCGTLVASTSLDCTIRTWKLEADSIVSTGAVIHVDGIAFSVTISPDGSRIVVGADYGLQMWDSATGESARAAKLFQYEGAMWGVAFSDDNTRIVSGSMFVRLWDAQTLQPLGDPLPGYSGEVESVAFSPGSASVAAGCSDSMVRIWDAETRQLTHTLVSHTECVMSVAFSPSGKHCASGGSDNLIYIWDVAEGRAVGVLKGHTDTVFSVAWSLDGTYIVSGSSDRTVRVWDRIPVSDLF